ncbi:Variant surface glycoprotein [Trypanosoma congolense IL3000]|uniref:Variant surface glycoprotein n=1 Tax=Trypanosoma congolense (strain IL3000) TaxID=1068625 RepID=F9WE63_TRYCI|nr:Variant surface glycoprotein [Trypanosoma congolense IL3000]
MNRNLATLLVLWLGSGAWWGMEGAQARYRPRNEKASTLLCNAFRAAEGVRKYTNVSQNLKEKIKQAVYGNQGKAHFPEDGKLRYSGWFSRRVQYPRKSACEYYNKDFVGRQTDGAFAESLLGAFFCVCAPPITDKNTRLCGVYHGSQRGAWSGNFGRGRVDYLLLQDVWDRVISQCTASTKDPETNLARVRKLDMALAAFRWGIRLHSTRTEYLYILGDIYDIQGCSGRAGNDICAAYHQQVGRWGIPWEHTLRHLLPDLYKQVGYVSELTKEEKTVPTTPSHTSATVGPHETYGTHGHQETYMPPLPSREVLVDDEGHAVMVQDDDFPEDLPNSTEAGWEAEENETSNPVQGPIPNPTSDLDPTSPEAAEGIVAHLTAAAHEGGASITPACAWRLFTATVALLG